MNIRQQISELRLQKCQRLPPPEQEWLDEQIEELQRLERDARREERDLDRELNRREELGWGPKSSS